MFSKDEVIDRQYRVVGTLSANSGFGDVYLVKNEGAAPLTGTEPEPLFALKILRQLDEDSRELFKREYHILRWATNENCQLFARFFDYGVVDERPYFVMEYIRNGVTIRKLLDGMKEGIGIKMVRDVLERLLDGLTFVHRRHIIHRDIKPENLMILGEQLKILDLGIAKYASRHIRLLNEGVSEDRRTHKIGTPRYMAPEQFNENEQAVAATDLYQVGLLAYEMFTGRHALVGNGQTPRSWLDWRELHRRCLLISFSDLGIDDNNDTIRKFENWIKSLVRPHPSGRLSSAQDAFGKLQQVFGDSWTRTTEAEEHCPYCGHRNSRAKNWTADADGRLVCCCMCGRSWLVWIWGEPRASLRRGQANV